MKTEILNVLYVVILSTSALWVYTDARKINVNPIFWSLVTALGMYPLGFVYYLARVRSNLMEESYPTPEEFKEHFK